MNTENAVNAEVSTISALGRLLIALIFIRGGINKLGSIAATVATMRNHGIDFIDTCLAHRIRVDNVGLFSNRDCADHDETRRS
jgi:uncharacterized membrane protein YphA (DoxX/SURF4 family)